MGEGVFGLHLGRLEFGVVKRNERLAFDPLLPLLDEHLGHRPGDLAADIRAIGRQHVAGGHDRLDNRAARRAVRDDRRSEERARPLPSAQTDHDEGRERKPTVRPNGVEQAIADAMGRSWDPRIPY